MPSHPRDQRIRNRLTERQRQVIEQLSHGRSDSQIAATLSLKLYEVRSTIASIKNRLNCRNRIELALMWQKCHRRTAREAWIVCRKRLLAAGSQEEIAAAIEGMDFTFSVTQHELRQRIENPELFNSMEVSDACVIPPA